MLVAAERVARPTAAPGLHTRAHYQNSIEFPAPMEGRQSRAGVHKRAVCANTFRGFKFYLFRENDSVDEEEASNNIISFKDN